MQAVEMQLATPERNDDAEQIQCASVTAQPVAPMAVRAQVSAQAGRDDRSCDAARCRSEKMLAAASVMKRMVAGNSAS